MTAEHAPRILYQVKQVELAVRGRLDAVVRPHGITVTQYTALTVLEQHPEMSSAQLARHAFVSAQAMEGIVRALEGAGLIERARDPQNRRRMTISLTPAGVALLAACRDDVDRIEGEAFASLSAQQRGQLGRWLQEARRALEQPAAPVD
ncbi:MarR family winged helix-turn-helix transcriptional regulator [Microbacterium trichothecenolyticum]|uniref:HTH-type transcriptional repressor NicR n=1 Tax=Microbacterium trichothecenolyticum TaxID=69370 RepID=A0A0M2H8S5_MICTR|nr:MarR family transcriptional regulator [Microbacterium trichothecenolyticum]KJL42950.1 HTH-type transcriptional repressor NicR [Microbacterium trichothecenolyticum]